MSWVFMRHPDTGGEAKFPDSPDVLEAYEARGWVRDEMPVELDPDALNRGASIDVVRAEEAAADLRGEALDEALKNAGLPRTGTADEKRARLAEHEAESAENPPEEGEESNG